MIFRFAFDCAVLLVGWGVGLLGGVRGWFIAYIYCGFLASLLLCLFCFVVFSFVSDLFLAVWGGLFVLFDCGLVGGRLGLLTWRIACVVGVYCLVVSGGFWFMVLYCW